MRENGENLDEYRYSKTQAGYQPVSPRSEQCIGCDKMIPQGKGLERDYCVKVWGSVSRIAWCLFWTKYGTNTTGQGVEQTKKVQ